MNNVATRFACVLALITGVVMSCLAVSFQVAANPLDNNAKLVSTSIITQSSLNESNRQTTLALIMTPKKGWHGYWQNPGDAGFANSFQWTLPKGVTIGPFEYPAPSQLLISDIMNYIYHGEYVLLAPISIDKTVTDGTVLPLSLDMSYLVCDPQTCLPEQQTIESIITLEQGSTSPVVTEQFQQWQAKLPKPLNVRGQFSVEDSTFTLSLPLPDSVSVDGAHLYPIVNELLQNNAPQKFSHSNDQLTIKTLSGDDIADEFKGVLVLGNGTSLSFSADKTDHIALAVNPITQQNDTTLWLAITALMGAVLGGLLLNVMPCVFPILSLKILSLSNLSSEREAKIGSVAYTLGAVLVCLLLGSIILGLRALGHQIGWAFQLQNPNVIALLIILMSAIGFNLAGLFELGTLTSGSKLQDKKGPLGDFWTGVLAAFIATPCTGPFMATALGAAMVLPIGLAFMVFAGLGIGMALPFLLVGFIPRLRNKLPKPGQWMVTARRILAVPMFITALGLVWILMRQSNEDFVLAILAATVLSSLGLWWTGLKQHSQGKYQWLPAIVLTLLPLLLVLYVTPSQRLQSSNIEGETTNIIRFNEDKLTALKAENDVFVYFTADWCLTCKVNEKTSIDRKNVQAALRENNIVTMVGDWTNGDSEITQFLSRHGRSGVPLYLWYKKGATDPTVLPQVLTPGTLLDQISAHNN
ncbi:thioredoxin family protein [Shewanella olleyana]|uniref:protein-disulfide reductase DsbD family protein n=1 Tax=Shewanella olleyana TaxID=135626 RepID=UPI00200DAD7D|nr:protein-disulfide reductase DsbD [Shewanella olleyana]MCL1068497.1 thioredoxin family protein [Shewanella olleyana]